MKDKELRLRIPKSLHKEYQMLCIELDLSLPKQTAELIRKFVEVQKENRDKLRIAKKE